MYLPPALFVGLAAVFVLGLDRKNPDELPSALIGKPAAVVALTDLGASVAFNDADLRDGRVKIVNFWASWCAPCRAEHPNLKALAEEGLPIFGVNYKDAPTDALGFLADLGNPFVRLGADASGRMGIDWGLYGVPESFVISGDGTVILRFPGPLTRQVIDTVIRPALEKAAAGE
jgi:cytochrome c biogenesis protein CcmG/thiol:disulfide interchange protein DsbE